MHLSFDYAIDLWVFRENALVMLHFIISTTHVYGTLPQLGSSAACSESSVLDRKIGEVVYLVVSDEK